MLQVKFPTEEKEAERLKGNKENNIGSFMRFAEQDYIAFRVLTFLGFLTFPLFLMQQSIEKYLKALMILNGIPIPTIKGGHNLTDLLKKIEKSNKINCPYLINEYFYEYCKNIEPFATAGRYPEEKISAWVFNNYELIYFLDEFIFNMRKLVRDNYGRNVLDPIENIEKGELIMNEIEHIKGSKEFLINAFYSDNNYFKKN